jgi:N6-L-threonylcarbamoyladenine synthase
VRAGLAVFHARFGAPTALVTAGGVAANAAIRSALRDIANAAGLPMVAPAPALCTDNGAMIAWAGAERLATGLSDTLEVSPRARWPLGEVRAPGAPAAA